MAKHRGLVSQGGDQAGLGVPCCGGTLGETSVQGPRAHPMVLLTCWWENVTSELCHCTHCRSGCFGQKQPETEGCSASLSCSCFVQKSCLLDAQKLGVSRMSDSWDTPWLCSFALQRAEGSPSPCHCQVAFHFPPHPHPLLGPHSRGHELAGPV